MDIFDKIETALNFCGVEQKDLTDYLGINKSAYSRWKNGKSKSYIKYIDKIAEFLLIPVSYFYDYSTPVGRELIEDFQNRSNMAAYEVTKGLNKITLIKNNNFITVDLTHEQLEKISRLLEIAMPELFEKFKYFEPFDNEE